MKDFSIEIHMLLYGKYDGMVTPSETNLRTSIRMAVVNNGEFELPINRFEVVDGKITVKELSSELLEEQEDD